MRLSRVAGIRHVGESFNQMAERIAALIENQRSLTNAVSHELRTPLARLAFEVDLLRQDRSGARREHILQDMQADIDELESMVAELLVYARLERPTDDMMPQETIDARDWLGDTLAQVDHLAQARAVRCVVHGDCPPQVRLHRRYMSRALLNLVQNAVRYASRLVHVSLAARADGAYELIVDDDGRAYRPGTATRSSNPSSVWTRAATAAPAALASGWPLSSAWRPRIMATSACMAARWAARASSCAGLRRGAARRIAARRLTCAVPSEDLAAHRSQRILADSRGRPFRLGGGLHDVARAARRERLPQLAQESVMDPPADADIHRWTTVARMIVGAEQPIPQHHVFTVVAIARAGAWSDASDAAAAC